MTNIVDFSGSRSWEFFPCSRKDWKSEKGERKRHLHVVVNVRETSSGMARISANLIQS